jgi:transcription factor WhiB
VIVDLERRWEERAACKGTDTEMFFPPMSANAKASPSTALQRAWNKAKEVCAECPVQPQCARDFLGEPDGVWGGMDPYERRQVRALHARKVTGMKGRRKEEYARLAYSLHADQHLSYSEVARVMGLTTAGATELGTYFLEHLKPLDTRPVAKVIDLRLPEPEPEQVISWPDIPPRRGGDSWALYAGRVTRANYLGQTADGAWFFMRVAKDHDSTTLWLPAGDVKNMSTSVPRILERVSEANRKHGNHRPREAGTGKFVKAG